MDTISTKRTRTNYIGFVSLILVVLIAIYLNSIDVTIALIWILSLIAGLTFQRSRLCFASSFRDMFLFGSSKSLRGILLGLSIATIGFTLIMRSIVPDPLMGSIPSDPHILPFGLSTIIGGLLFGFGMVISGGCVSGSLYRIGEGYVASLFSILGVIIGLGLLSLSWNWWWGLLISKEPKIWLPNFLNMGYAGGFMFTLFLILLTFIAITFYEHKSGHKDFVVKEKLESSNSLKEKILVPYKTIFNTTWSVNVGAITLGLISMFMLLIATPFGVTGQLFTIANSLLNSINLAPIHDGLSSLAGCVSNASSDNSLISNSFVATWGIIPGSFIASNFSGEFKIRMPKEKKRLAQSLIGGVYMGYGAGLAIGCTIGSFFSAVPSLSLSGWLFALSLAGGSYVGVKVIKRI
ncbi:MAG: hypothetical protein CL506_04780 [Actinobacteria bacterium]|jgi:uncharacterized membrane protein YedE/YeeE|nr:hypothetical protein [Actinomycetota bacterium]|tara:strand:- start:734 stop:1954 length:1221 start_codon:yes stop_codon:yes gene_type:complete